MMSVSNAFKASRRDARMLLLPARTAAAPSIAGPREATADGKVS